MATSWPFSGQVFSAQGGWHQGLETEKENHSVFDGYRLARNRNEKQNFQPFGFFRTENVLGLETAKFGQCIRPLEGVHQGPKRKKTASLSTKTHFWKPQRKAIFSASEVFLSVGSLTDRHNRPPTDKNQ